MELLGMQTVGCHITYLTPSTGPVTTLEGFYDVVREDSTLIERYPNKS